MLQNGPTLRDRLTYQPRELKFGTSGRRGEVIHLSQLEIYINALSELEYLLSLPAAEGGITAGDHFYFATDLRPSSTAFVPEQGGRGEIAQTIRRAINDAGLLPVYLGRIPTPALTAYAVATLALVALRMPETLARPNPQALQPGMLLRTWGTVLRHPTFWAFSLLTTAAYGGLFTFLAASSFVFIEVLGLSRTQYGWVLLSTALAYFVGTFVCRHLLARHGLRRTVALAGGLSLGGCTLMALVAWMGWHQPWALLAPFYLFMLGHGIHQPCGQTGAVGPFPQAAGVASALNGFMMMLAAFAIGGWVGTHLDGTVWPLVHGVWFWSVLLAAIAWTLVQKFGEPREPREPR